MGSDQRAGAEIVYGGEECERRAVEILAELGFPKGVLPVKEVVELGRVKETGFIWMKMKGPFDYFFEAVGSWARYSPEVTAYAEKGRFRNVTGIKSKKMMMWVPLSEMTIDGPAGKKLFFKTSVGIGMSFPITAFMTAEEKKVFLEKVGA